MAKIILKCQNCGAELSEDATFCGECGSRIEPQVTVYVPVDATQEQSKEQKNKKWPTIISAVLIVCMLGVGLYLLKVKPDAEKDPEQLQTIGTTQTTAPAQTEPHATQQPVATTMPEQTTEAPIPAETEKILEFNREDISMVMQGERWKLYDGQIPVDDIQWTSDDEKVAVIKKGIVEAVGKGTTNVHAEYGDQKVSCIIRCDFEETSGGLPGSGDYGEDGGSDGSSALTYSICAYGTPISDVTIYNEQTSITFRDSDGKVIDVTWESTDTSIFTVLESGDGCVLKSVSVGTAKLKAVYEGKTYLCIVRVAA